MSNIYAWKLLKELKSKADFHKNRRGGDDDYQMMKKKIAMILIVSLINSAGCICGIGEALDSYRRHFLLHPLNSPTADITGRMQKVQITSPLINLLALYLPYHSLEEVSPNSWTIKQSNYTRNFNWQLGQLLFSSNILFFVNLWFTDTYKEAFYETFVGKMFKKSKKEKITQVNNSNDANTAK